MKKLFALITLFLLCISLAACNRNPAVVTEPEAEPSVATEPVTEPVTEPITEPETEPFVSGPLSEVSYIMDFDPAADIYEEPSATSKYIQDVGIYGDFGIVEEVYDEDGNRWGRLESGLGWVQLAGEFPDSHFIRTCHDCGYSEPDVDFSMEVNVPYCTNCSANH